MKTSLLKRVLALIGLGSAASASAAVITAPKPPKDRFRNMPPPPPHNPRPVDDLFYLPGSVKGWNSSPPSNQRKVRKARRQAHANGKRNAFAR